MSLQDAKELLARAKTEYKRALRVVDSRLKAAVAKDPGNLDEARQVQNSYGTELTSETTLAALVQPPPPPLDADGHPVYHEAGPASGLVAETPTTESPTPKATKKPKAASVDAAVGQ